LSGYSAFAATVAAKSAATQPAIRIADIMLLFSSRFLFALPVIPAVLTVVALGRFFVQPPL
jgi:hypothetical protein